MRKDGSRKCEERGYEQLGRAARMGRRHSSKPEVAARFGGLEMSSIQEQTDTRQGRNWKESLIRHSRLLQRDHHNFDHGQRDGPAQEHVFKDQKTWGLKYNIYPPEKSSAFHLAQNYSLQGSGRKICKTQG